MFEKDLPLLAEAMEMAGSDNPAQAEEGFQAIATVFEGPVREAIFPGNLFDDLFTMEDRDGEEVVYYHTQFIQPGREGDYKAYGVPSHGEPGMNFASPGKFVVPTFDVQNVISVHRKDLRLKKFDIVKKAVETLYDGLTWKMSDDCWAAIIAAVVANGSIQSDSTATVGRLSKGLLEAMKTHFQRSTKSNPTSKNGFKMTRLYMSPEAHSSLVYLTNADVDEVTRRTIIMDEDGKVPSFMGVTLHSMVQFGVAGANGADYQAAITAAGGTLPGAKTQFVVGVDGSKKDKLAMPVVERPTLMEDPIAPRRGERSWVLSCEYNAVVLDPRVVRGGAL